MLPAFLAGAIIYAPPYRRMSSLQLGFLFAIIALVIASSIGLYLWVNYLHILAKEKIANEMNVKESNEISSVVSNYIMAYAISIISVSVVGGIRGIALLALLVVVVGLYAFGWNAMLFNPFLMLCGYRVYWMELEDGSTGYLILQVSGGPVMNMKGSTHQMIKIDNYLYYLKNNS
jgi:hypothetical protein